MSTTARLRHLLPLLLLPFAACSASALPGPDPGDSDGGIGAPDLAPASCGALADEVAQWLASHQACQTDADCTVVYTACGLPGVCGTFANQGAQGATLDGLVSTWEQGCGAAIDCGCPGSYPVPACNDGVCGPLREPSPPKGSGRIGDPCTTDGDCLLGACLGPQEGFPDGYCSMRACDTSDVACPAGSICRAAGVGTDGAVCLLACDASAGQGACRTDGYACCSGAGPSDGNGVCAPSNSYLCGEL